MNYIKNFFNFNKPDFNSFDLISKLPNDPYYNEIIITPIVVHPESTPSSLFQKPYPQDGIFFNDKISCADDIVYHGIKNTDNVEFKALGFKGRLKSAIMQSSKHELTKDAKYILFTSYAMKLKFGNPVIGVFENTNPSADPNLILEYDIFKEQNVKYNFQHGSR